MNTQNAFIYFPVKWWREAGASTARQVDAKMKIEDIFTHLENEDLREAYKAQLADVLNRAHEVEKASVNAIKRELANLYAKYEIAPDPATLQVINELEDTLAKPMENPKFAFNKVVAPKKEVKNNNKDEDFNDLVEFPAGFEGDKKAAFKHKAFQHDGRLWVIEKNYCRSVSNFELDIKFHIPNGKDMSYQLVVLKSIHGAVKTDLLNTDELVTVNSFKRVLRRLGEAFSFSGGESTLDKVLDWKQLGQKSASYISVLGYQTDTNLWAWSNEVTLNTGKALKLDEYGMFTHENKTWMIPANSVMFSNHDDEFQDQKNFRTIDSDVTFEDWSKLHYEVYGTNGIIAQAYFMLALFRDHIYGLNKIRATPILNLYGPRGCGKGVFADSIMRLLGIPQKEISLQSSNTTKGFLRKFAQFRNSLVWLDEYKNNLPPHIQETIKNLYDGVSYTRARRTNDFQSDTLPINSSCILSGEEMPTGNAALFSRVILLTFEPGKDRTDAERKRFQDLKKMESEGITNVTKKLLKHRDQVVNNFENIFIEKQNHFFEALRVHRMDDRFIMGIAMISAVFACLSEYIDTPFSQMDLDIVLQANVIKQFEIFSSNDDLGRFWLLVENLVSQGVLAYGIHYEIVAGELKIKMQDVHPLYLKESRLRGDQIVLPKATLENYLASDPTTFIRKGKSRIGNVQNPVHHFTFDYNELVERYEIDLKPNFVVPGPPPEQEERIFQ